MPEGPDGKTIIVVKKVVTVQRTFGGSWKVAYADLVTSLMALFLVLWLVNSASVPTRQRIASYFRQPGIFQRGSGTPLEEGGQGILPDTFAPPADANSQIQPSERIYDLQPSGGEQKDTFGSPVEARGTAEKLPIERDFLKERLIPAPELPRELPEILSRLNKAVNEENVKLLGKVDVDVSAHGLVIEIMDTDTASMFEVGSAAILPEAELELLTIAGILKDLPNSVDIEGHTDGRQFRAMESGPLAGYDNWNLSSDRANAARHVLERAGITKTRIQRVVGYADQRPKVADDPLHPSNRRITLSVSFSGEAQASLAGKNVQEVEPRSAGEKSAAQGKESRLETSVPWASSDAPPQNEKDGENAGSLDIRLSIGSTSPESGAPSESSKSSTISERKDKIFGREHPFFPF